MILYPTPGIRVLSLIVLLSIVHAPIALGVAAGALAPVGPLKGNWFRYHLEALAEKFGFSLEAPFGSLPGRTQDIVLDGSDEEIVVRYDFERGRQDKTHHPFQTTISLGDVRITTHVKENDLRDALFSTIHESGHAMYEQGINPWGFEGTPLAQGTSAGVHESQSRLWENVAGRSRGFWDFFYPRLQAVFPDQLGKVSLYLVGQGIADPKRVGIMGGYYGGYATLAGVAFTPDVYAAAVSIVGPSNLITLLNSIPPYWEPIRKLFHERMGDPNTADGEGAARAPVAAHLGLEDQDTVARLPEAPTTRG